VFRLLLSQRVTAKQISEPTSRSKAGIWFFLLLLAGATVAGVWYANGRRVEAPAAEAAPSVKSTLHLETFVLNLADPGQRSYLRAGIDLGLGREKAGPNEVLPIAQVRDAILGVLGQARVDDLLTVGGKAKLKAEVLSTQQQRVPQLMVREVYFTEFLIQR